MTTKSRRTITVAHRDFLMLWTGQSLSLFGDQFMVIALPLIAVQLIGVSASQAALLPFAFLSPFLLFGLPAGVIVERLPRRITMIVCNIIQAGIFIAVSVLGFSGVLTFALLMLLVGIAGIATVFFQIAYNSYIPELFFRIQDLQKSNSRLSFSESMAKTFGPMAAGSFIGWLGPVAAIAANATTFVLSVLSLSIIKHRPPTTSKQSVKKQEPGWMYQDIREGLHFVFHHKQLEPVIVCAAVYVLFADMIDASFVLYCLKVLNLSSVVIGFVVGASAAGFPVGNLICTKLVSRFGVARTLVMGAIVSVTGLIFIPIAGSVNSIRGMIVANMLHGVGEGAFAPTALTLRQSVTPNHLMSRINSVQRFLIWGVAPISSLVAALIIKNFGLNIALWVGGVGSIFCLPLLIRKGIVNEVLNPHNFGSSSRSTENENT